MGEWDKSRLTKSPATHPRDSRLESPTHIMVAQGSVPLDLIDERELVGNVSRAWADHNGGWIATVNVDILRRTVRDTGFRSLLSQATFRTIDGAPVLWAARVLGARMATRVAGADLIWALGAQAAADGKRIFLIGGAPGAAAGAADALQRRDPSVHVVGIAVPDKGFERDPVYMRRLEAQLRDASPDLVLVGLGSPKQDELIARLRVAVPRAWFVGVGIAFSFTSGDLARAPRRLQILGLEWLHRLFQEPVRLTRRYLIDDAPFALGMLAGAVVVRARRSSLTRDFVSLG